MKKRILHLLTWEWKNIENHLEKIKEVGFDAVQISPITPCKKIWDGNGRIKYHSAEWYDQIHKDWWAVYQPTSLSTIGNHLGTKEDFISLCNKGTQLGIDIYPDLILRHAANDEHDNLKPHKDVDYRLLPYLKANQVDANNYHDRKQQTDYCTGMPIFDYDNIEFQEDICLPLLQEILKYAHGIRFDQLCKHYRLPGEGGTFFQNVISKLPKDKFYYGEGIETDDKYLDEYSQYLYPIVSYHEYWGRKNTVRFMESHDTTLSFMYTLAMTPQARLDGYERCLHDYDIAMYYARRDDETIFSQQMKEINHRYR